MRGFTNIMLFLVALLAITGVYAIREESFPELQKNFAGVFGPSRPPMARRAAPPLAPPPTRRARATARDRVVGPNAAPNNVEVTVVAVPLAPKPSTDSIQIGMDKITLWENFGQPDVVTLSRDGESLRETYIYLETSAKATVVRLINGMVASVGNTRTINPPLLVPQNTKVPSPLFLASDSK